jgi:hypothetical protein
MVMSGQLYLLTTLCTSRFIPGKPPYLLSRRLVYYKSIGDQRPATAENIFKFCATLVLLKIVSYIQ